MPLLALFCLDCGSQNGFEFIASIVTEDLGEVDIRDKGAGLDSGVIIIAGDPLDPLSQARGTLVLLQALEGMSKELVISARAVPAPPGGLLDRMEAISLLDGNDSDDVAIAITFLFEGSLSAVEFLRIVDKKSLFIGASLTDGLFPLARIRNSIEDCLRSLANSAVMMDTAAMEETMRILDAIIRATNDPERTALYKELEEHAMNFDPWVSSANEILLGEREGLFEPTPRQVSLLNELLTRGDDYFNIISRRHLREFLLYQEIESELGKIGPAEISIFLGKEKTIPVWVHQGQVQAVVRTIDQSGIDYAVVSILGSPEGASAEARYPRPSSLLSELARVSGADILQKGSQGWLVEEINFRRACFAIGYRLNWADVNASNSYLIAKILKDRKRERSRRRGKAWTIDYDSIQILRGRTNRNEPRVTAIFRLFFDEETYVWIRLFPTPAAIPKANSSQFRESVLEAIRMRLDEVSVGERTGGTNPNSIMASLNSLVLIGRTREEVINP
jgi:hypothetical protein